MAFLIKDRVLETCSSPGTGAVTLLGAVTGYQSFSTAFSSTNGTTTYYCIADQGGANWEVGLGTWNTGNTFTRTTVYASSNAGATVNFASGTQNVFCTYPAEQALYLGGPLGTPSSGTVTNLTGTASININGTVGATTANTGAFTTLTSTSDATLHGLTVGLGGGSVSSATAVGYQAGYSNTTGTYNTFVGYQSGLNVTASNNCFVGSRTATTSSSGGGNSLFGDACGNALTSGASNAYYGFATGNGTTSGSYNTAFGTQALNGNTIASNNTAVGYQAGYTSNANGNVFNGYQSGYTSTGAQNTFVGSIAGYYNAAGAGNTAVGNSAYASGGTTAGGNYNTAIGAGSLQANTTASNNTAVGYQAGYSNTIGPNNAVLGYQALYTNTTCGYNTAIGLQALYTANRTADTNGYNCAIGAFAGYSITTGNYNTLIGTSVGGYGAGHLITTGSKNSILGGYNGNQGGLDIRTSSNYIVLSDGDGNPKIVSSSTTAFIAANSTFSNNLQFDSNEFYPNIDNTIKLGYPANRWTTVYATTSTINTSDANTKQDIANLDDAEKRVAVAIKSLIKKYRFKDAVAKKGNDARIHIGAIAQEVQAAFVTEGLDPARYALFCSDTWYEVDGKPKNDEAFYTAETEGAVEITQLGLRYEELLAFVISAL